jgi:uncharacterized protein YkwD
MRTALLVCGAVVCCCAVLAWHPGAAHARGAALDGTERKVVRLVNRIRASHGLRRLRVSAGLARAASDHTGDILRADYFSHSSSDGTPMPTRVRRYTRAQWVGETIAVASRGRGLARLVVRMWMASPGHRAVLLAPAGRRIGVGTARGMLGGARRAVITADLASAH